MLQLRVGDLFRAAADPRLDERGGRCEDSDGLGQLLLSMTPGTDENNERHCSGRPKVSEAGPGPDR